MSKNKTYSYKDIIKYIIHWRTLKTQKMKIIIFWTKNIFNLFYKVKSAGNVTLYLSIPKTGVL